MLLAFLKQNPAVNKGRKREFGRVAIYYDIQVDRPIVPPLPFNYLFIQVFFFF
jgi:hypothetical protein